eukprot:638671-Lingulodinium_polyedra.AAC.1
MLPRSVYTQHLSSAIADNASVPIGGSPRRLQITPTSIGIHPVGFPALGTPRKAASRPHLCE